MVTRPDKPTSRRQVLTPPPVKIAAERLRLPLSQPAKLDAQFVQELAAWQPDVAVLAAYGRIIKPDLLSVPKYGFVNIHPSLLPRHRGASPLAGTILSGDTETGVTIMQMDAGLDTGPILAQQRWPLSGKETCGALTQRLSTSAIPLLLRVLPALLDGTCIQQRQDESKATMTRQLTKEQARIDWAQPAHKIERAIRAYNPWPAAWTMLAEKRIKILSASLGGKSKEPTGTVLGVGEQIGIVCGDGTMLLLQEIQPEGKKPMDGEAFSRGYRTSVGTSVLAAQS